MIIPIAKRRGFTIVEILFVIVVMAILAAIVIPRFSGSGFYDRYLTYTTAHKVAADIRLARRLAVTHGKDHRVIFSNVGGSNQYVIEEDAGGWVQVSEGKIISDEINLSGDSEIEFSSNGAAASSGTFRFAIGTDRYQIDVIAATGRVKLEEY